MAAVLVSYRLVSTQARKKNPPQAAPAAFKTGPRQERSGKRESRVDQAYAEIRRRILDNHYAPGHHVLEQELAADLGMSRTPVREALVRLQNERFVQLIPRHGMRVVPLSIQELREVYEVLTSLELTAIDRLSRLDLEEEALATIEKTVDEMDLAVRKKDVDAWAKADERFHRMLVTLCGNQRLVDDGRDALGAGAPRADDDGPVARLARTIEPRAPRAARRHSSARLAAGADPPCETSRAGDDRDPQSAPPDPAREFLAAPATAVRLQPEAARSPERDATA